MAKATPAAIVSALLDRYPRTYAEELRVRRLEQPAGLFQVLVMALLMSARIRAHIAANATAALFKQGWTTPARMVDATWEDRTRTLNRAGYARYDERTSTMLGDTATLLLERYRGDLRRLRDQAERDPTTERRLLKDCKGVGDIGVDIYFREVQRAWPELYPFADQRILDTAQDLGLGRDVRRLTRLAQGDDFVRLVDALVRVRLDHTEAEIRDVATQVRRAR
jgi:endonuclease III